VAEIREFFGILSKIVSLGLLFASGAFTLA
jgi:hypothetical protein